MEQNRFSYIEKRLRELESEKALLIQELENIRAGSHDEAGICFGAPALEKTPETAEEKISLFLSLFRSRNDLYSRLWENEKKGTRGFSPVCANEWIPGVCRKPAVKCHECVSRRFEEFNEKAVKSHLEGKIVVGSYAIDKDDTCIFLAADFDGDGWKDDARAYRCAAGDFGVDVALEISRSGNGAHAWIFFSHSVPARMARKLGTMILSHASSDRSSFSFNSYDRFFPSQDYIPEGGFGNLIALPLQKASRLKNTTVFVNESLVPYDNQWEYLSRIKRLSHDDLEKLLYLPFDQSAMPFLYESIDQDVMDAERAISIKELNHDEFKNKEKIHIRIGARVAINISSLPGRIVYALKRIATFANPKFFELQRLRFSTWRTPRYICCAELIENEIYLPRGTLDECASLIKSTGGECIIHDERPEYQKITMNFSGVLKKDQEMAVETILEHEYGVLVAPPGIGKTVMACAVLAARGVPTLILVHRKQLVEQWKSQLTTLFGIEKKSIGVIAGAGKKVKGFIDIAMLQTIARMKDTSPLTSAYGMIVIDECHHVPAVSFESVLAFFPSRYVLGLTATPYRKDGLQPIIHMQCGPIRHTMNASESSIIERKVIVRETNFILPDKYGEKPAIYEIWDAIVDDENRLRMIANDVKDSLSSGRFPLIVSDRKEHLLRLSGHIREATAGMQVSEFVLIGDMGKKARKKAMEDISALRGGITRPYILSTTSLIGEGFDLPELDTLFIAMPVSFKGRIVQYAGRIHRETGGKRDVIIYDYCDSSLGLTLSMFKKRLSAYREMSYEIIIPESEKLARLTKKPRYTGKTLF